MDRVICGDVGFGKTEVALRAAFAVALGGETSSCNGPNNTTSATTYRNI